MIPTLLLIITCLAIGAIVGGGIIYVLNDAGIVNKSISAINENRGRLSQAIKPYLRERSRLRKRRNRVRKDLRGLRKSINRNHQRNRTYGMRVGERGLPSHQLKICECE